MTFLKLAIAATLSLTATQAIAADLWSVQSEDGFTILFDGDQLGKAGDLTSAVYYMDGMLAERRFAELHVEFNCAARQVRVTKALVYDSDFKVTPDAMPSDGDKWEKADDGATGKALTDFACGPRDEWPRLGRKQSEQDWRAVMKQQSVKKDAGKASTPSSEAPPR
ncbi:hypothetical protein G4G27_13735 [Sphingomonas sp. So64.6b]|uniref:hypothetical protein n=1 Tax=Sphingomonas sp. So64.6b TaxID=2997354 RepID=UPI00160116F7|nr:hypothetical protein [Sphingomonas sp. So64.6b]QNA84938.1 hypothetical protein G4G27_13735 [Sphingomonas sp. So64.6b]